MLWVGMSSKLPVVAARRRRQSDRGGRRVARGTGTCRGRVDYRQSRMPTATAGILLEIGEAAGRVVVRNDGRRRLGRAVEWQELADDRSVSRHCYVVVVNVELGWSRIHSRHLVLGPLPEFSVTPAK